MKIATRSVCCVLLVLIVLLEAAAAQPKVEAVPEGLRVAEQADSPVKLTLTGMRDFGNGYRHLTYTVSNTSSKVVWGIVLTGLEQPGGEAAMVLGAAIQPNGKQSFGGPLGNGNEAGDRTVSVDLVLFRDGTYWGPGNSDDAEFLRGTFEGQRAAVKDVKQVLEKGDEAALREHLTREPYLPEPYRGENNTRRQQGFVRGYGTAIIGLRRDLLGRGDAKGIPWRISEMEVNLGLAAPVIDGRRQISREYWFNEPVKIERLYRGGKRVEVDEKFVADAEWLRGLMVFVRNNSGKSISHISLGLDFPETISTGNIMMFSLSYGPHPASSRPASEKERAEIPVAANVSFEIVMDEAKFSELKRFIESRHTLDSLRRVIVRISMIHFSDGTAWNGSWLKQDPADPRRWVPVER